MQPAVSIALWHGRRSAEVHHVQGSARADVGNAGAGDRAEPVAMRGLVSPCDEVGDFSRREIRNRAYLTLVNEGLHRLTPQPRRMKHQAIMAPSQRFDNPHEDRKSTRLNSSHVKISYAVFCLKKKNK